MRSINRNVMLLTTVSAGLTSDLKQFHLLAGQCLGAKGASGNQFSPATLPDAERLLKNSFKTYSAVNS